MVNFKTEATAQLSEFFLQELIGSKFSLRDFEVFVCKEGTEVLRNAMISSLEKLDDRLFNEREGDLKVKEKRERTLASTIGDLKFNRRIYTDKYKNSNAILDEALEIGYRSRISPHAFEFLINMASKVSYKEASNIMAEKGGSVVSANTIMRAIHQVGNDCKTEDAKLAYSLYLCGILPESKTESEQIFVESDGTYVSLQNGKKAEIKAMVAYSGKTKNDRPERIDACRFGCVGTKDEFWTQGFSSIAENFDITKIKKVHLGFDGESTYKQAEKYFLINAEFDGNLDPFHLNRAVRACFSEKHDGYKQVMSCLWYKNPKEAADLLESYSEFGEADARKAEIVAKYIRNNAEFIRKNDYTLGTMECEQEHLYKSRLAGVPRAWSIAGVDAIARIRSRIYSGRELVFRNRKDTISKEVLRKREQRVYDFFEKQPKVYQLTSGHGYDYPIQAHLNQKIKSGLISAWNCYRKGVESSDPY